MLKYSPQRRAFEHIVEISQAINIMAFSLEQFKVDTCSHIQIYETTITHCETKTFKLKDSKWYAVRN